MILPNGQMLLATKSRFMRLLHAWSMRLPHEYGAETLSKSVMPQAGPMILGRCRKHQLQDSLWQPGGVYYRLLLFQARFTIIFI